MLPEVTARPSTASPRPTLRRNGAYRQRYALEWLSRASDLRIHHARPATVAAGRVVGVLLLSRSPRALFRRTVRGPGQDRDSASTLIFGDAWSR